MVTVDVGWGGAVVTLTIPGGRLDPRTCREFVEHVQAVGEDRAVRVLRVRAAAPDFCTGASADLDRIAHSPDPASALASVGAPVLIALSGECASVGLEVALAADIRLVAPSARLRIDDIDHGVLPCWGGTQRLARCVRPAAAIEMLILGTAYDAARAVSAGLAHEVADDLTARLDELTEVLLGHGPLALRLVKEAVHRGAELPLRDGLRLEGDLNHLLAATADRAEGLAAFFAKRPPDFAGR